MESAILVDWDPVSELERRIDHGKEYEHWPEKSFYGSSSYVNGNSNVNSFHRRKSMDEDHGMPCVRGVFCGFRSSVDERARLKNANPDE